jgi:hypothetical protein
VTNGEEVDDDLHDGPGYRDVAEIGTGELYEALMGLAGFAENP